MAFSNVKSGLRAKYLKRRRDLAPSEVASLSASVQERFLSLAEYKAATRIALYSSFDSEVLTGEIFKGALLDGKQVFFPKADKDRSHLAFFKVRDGSELTPGLYNINEPVGSEFCEKGEVESFDMVVLPGVVFDANGTRIGYGKGFYDRVLKDTKAIIVGLSFEIQISEEPLPLEPHDKSINMLVTENSVLRF